MKINKLYYILFLSIIFIILFNNEILCQNNFNSTGKPIVLQHADSLIGSSFTGVQSREYNGHVRFLQGNVKVSCDRALHYIDENRVDLFGNVVITQEELILKSPAVKYDGNTGIAQTSGGIRITDNKSNLKAKLGVYSTQTQIANFYQDVVFWDDTMKITSDTMIYNKQTQYTKAYSNVKIENDSIIVFCDWFEYDRITLNSYAYKNVFVKGIYNPLFLTADTILNYKKENHLIAFGKPILYKVDSTTINKKIIDTIVNNDTNNLHTKSNERFDTMTVACDTIKTFKTDTGSVYIFINNVEIVKGATLASSTVAYLFEDKDLIHLYGKPIVWYDSTQLYGDTIFIHFPENKLKLIQSFTNSLAVSKGDSTVLGRTNQISGDKITLVFELDSIRSMNSYGNAKNLYFMANEEKPDGAARDICDSVSIYFENGNVSDIYWVGGVQGEYIPENLVVKNPLEFYLPNFHWSDSKPKGKVLIIRNK